MEKKKGQGGISVLDGKANARPTSAPHVVYITPTCKPYGGIRVIFRQAEGLLTRGYRVTVVGPDPAPEWYPRTVPYQQVEIEKPHAIPTADICIGTFWTTIESARASGAKYVFHLCQGLENLRPEYQAIYTQIDAVYRLSVPKVVVAPHLKQEVTTRYDCHCYVIGEAVDNTVFFPRPFRVENRPLRVGVVGPYGVPSKGVPDALRGLLRARQAGYAVEVYRASIDPLDEREARLGVTDRFFHNLDTAGMVRFYHEIDACVHPCHEGGEGFPIPSLEAMACGAPMALTTIRPFASFPDDAVLRFPPDNPEALVPVIAALMNPEKRRSLREAGLACIRTHHTPGKVLDRLEEAFRVEGAPVINSPAPPR
jgi:glycosyltransferase involved in cell wall biosynthesis